MSQYLSTDARKVTAKELSAMKSRGEKISMLTTYDYSFARLVDAGGVDVILVGDSAANVMAGYTTTLPITLDQMIYHTSCVVRGVEHALVVTDMPFGSYQGDAQLALRSAVRIVKESGTDCVKLEGGEEIGDAIRAILDAGIPVMGHLGLTPQSIHKFGTFGVRAKEEMEAEKLIRDAHLLEELGCCSLVLEKIPAKLASQVSQELHIPVIGIGAGGGTDGQVLVLQDMMGMTQAFSPKFLRRYADLGSVIQEAVHNYVVDVKGGDFPNEQESY